jgi:hypothetical protein
MGLFDFLKGTRQPEYTPQAAMKKTEEINQLLSAGDGKEAARQADDFLLFVKKSVGEKHTDYASMLGYTATVHYKAGDKTNARDLYRQSLVIKQALMGMDDPGTVKSMAQLGKVLYELGEFGEAETVLRDAFTCQVRIFGVNNNATRQTAVSLAGVYWAQGKKDELKSLQDMTGVTINETTHKAS